MVFASARELELAALLRTDLESLGTYTAENITVYVGGAEFQQALLQANTLPAQRFLAENAVPEKLQTMIELFQLGAAVSANRVAAALPHIGVAGLVELGIVAYTDNQLLRATVSLNPVRVADAAFASAPNWYVLSDLDDHLRGGVAADKNHVMGVGGATRALLAQAPAGSVKTAADIGTGCGIVALHLAARAQRVIATDISVRALRFATLNAVLNQVTNIDFRQGSLFAPLAGEKVDLLLSNPPFVIEPEPGHSFAYRSADLPADTLAQRMVTECVRYLHAGGTAIMLANWEICYGPAALSEPVANLSSWLKSLAEQSELAAVWAIERDRLSPLAYAQLWTRDSGVQLASAAGADKISAYLHDFTSRNVAAIGLGSLHILRKPDPVCATVTQPVVRQQQISGAAYRHPESESYGVELATTWDVSQRAAQLSDSQLLAGKWVLCQGITENRLYQPGAADPSAIHICVDAPFVAQLNVDTLTAAALGVCDGDLTLWQICQALAEYFAVDAQAVAGQLLPEFRELCWYGVFADIIV